MLSRTSVAGGEHTKMRGLHKAKDAREIGYLQQAGSPRPTRTGDSLLSKCTWRLDKFLLFKGFWPYVESPPATRVWLRCAPPHGASLINGVQIGRMCRSLFESKEAFIKQGVPAPPHQLSDPPQTVPNRSPEAQRPSPNGPRPPGEARRASADGRGACVLADGGARKRSGTVWAGSKPRP